MVGWTPSIQCFEVVLTLRPIVVAFRSRENWEGDEWVITTDKQTMMNDFRGWSQHVQNIISNVQKPNIWALFMHPPAPYYSKGRICLLGDAAHASTPHCGAGAGMAIEDSYVLSGLVGEETLDGDLEAAFRAFDAVRRERSQKLVTESKRQAIIYEFESEIGDDKEKLRDEMTKRMHWIWDEDLPGEARLASELMKKFKKENETSKL
jgi:salicylate hydroxylase